MSDRRVALVSGVARPPGLGFATALRLARAGYSVACSDLIADSPADTAEVTPAHFDDVVAEVNAAATAAGGGEVLALPIREVTASACEHLVAATIGRFGRLDVCCALNGVSGPSAGDGPLIDLTEAAWRRSVEVNLTLPWMLTTAAGRSMIAAGRPGAITVLSSEAGLVSKPNVGAVGSARAAVNHLVAVLAKELGPYGIRVNAVAPLSVAPTDRFPNPGLLVLAERAGLSFDDWTARQIPLGRAQDADETAAVIEFLCGDGASFVSGTTVPTHGGAGP
jgi:NAD(P)-dependent dehydrogenase (short-subunit alcohol dehydrogenase family)